VRVFSTTGSDLGLVAASRQGLSDVRAAAAVFVGAALDPRLKAAINAAWDEDVLAASTSEPLTVTVFGSTIIQLLCAFPVFPGWRTKSFPCAWVRTQGQS
jgi:hypothetical protein